MQVEAGPRLPKCFSRWLWWDVVRHEFGPSLMYKKRCLDPNYSEKTESCLEFPSRRSFRQVQKYSKSTGYASKYSLEDSSDCHLCVWAKHQILVEARLSWSMVVCPGQVLAPSYFSPLQTASEALWGGDHAGWQPQDSGSWGNICLGVTLRLIIKALI